MFGFQGHTIDMYGQYVSTLKDLGIHDEEGSEINISDPLTTAEMISCSFL